MDNYTIKGLLYSKIIILISFILSATFLIIYIYTHKIPEIFISIMFLLIALAYVLVYELYNKGKLHFNELTPEKKKYKRKFLLYNMIALLLIVIVISFIVNTYIRLLSFIIFMIFVLYNINKYNHKLYT